MSSVISVLILMFLCGAYTAQTGTGNDLTVYKKYSNSLFIKKCNMSWAIPEQATFLKSCEIPQPSSEDMSTDSSTAHLCITYLDLLAKLCSEISKNASLKLEMPKSKADIDDILNALDTTSMAHSFCNVSHVDILNVTMNSSRSLPFIQKTVDALSDDISCPLTCVGYDHKLNPLCKSILWISKMLNSHAEMIRSLNKINQHVKNVQSQSKPLNQTKAEKEQTLQNDVVDKKGSSPVISNLQPDLSVEKPSNTPISVQQIPSFETAVPKQSSKSNSAEVKSSTLNENASSGKELPYQETPVLVQPSNKTIVSDTKKVSVAPPQPINIEDEMNKPEIDDPDEDIKLDNELELPEDNFSLNDDQSEKLSKSDVNGFESASGIAGGAAPVEYPKNDPADNKVRITGKYVDTEDSHFFPYFLILSGILIFGYVLYNNKNKVLGLLLEGRRGDTRRRCPTGGPAYRKLDCTLEEVVNSAPPSHNPHIVY